MGQKGQTVVTASDLRIGVRGQERGKNLIRTSEANEDWFRLELSMFQRMVSHWFDHCCNVELIAESMQSNIEVEYE